MGCRCSILSKSCRWTQGSLTNHSQCHHTIFKLSKINTVLLLNTVFQRKLSVQTLISPKIFSMLYLYITLCIKIKFSPLSPMYFKMIVVGDIFTTICTQKSLNHQNWLGLPLNYINCKEYYKLFQFYFLKKLFTEKWSICK